MVAAFFCIENCPRLRDVCAAYQYMSSAKSGCAAFFSYACKNQQHGRKFRKRISVNVYAAMPLLEKSVAQNGKANFYGGNAGGNVQFRGVCDGESTANNRKPTPTQKHRSKCGI